jgi:hypothetical protein
MALRGERSCILARVRQEASLHMASARQGRHDGDLDLIEIVRLADELKRF